MKISRHGSKVISVFFLALFLNISALISTVTFVYFTTSQQKVLVEKGQQLNVLLNKLFELEAAAGDLDAPGNDIFESRNVDFERNRFNEYRLKIKEEISSFRKLIFEFISEADVKKKIVSKIDLTERFREEIIKSGEQIFLSFEQNDIPEASKKMAQMDRQYSEHRRTTTEIRSDLRKILDALSVKQSVLMSDQSKKMTWVMSINLLCTLFLLIVAVALGARSRSDHKILNFYKFALDQAAIVAITDKNGKITFANEKFSKISGYSVDELVGQDHRMVNSRFHQKSFFIDLWKTVLSGKVWTGEVRNIAKDKNIYWVDSTIVPMLDRAGRVSRLMSIRFDITQRKENELLIEKRQKELDRFFNLTSDFLGILGADGMFIKMSDSFVSILGYELNDLRNCSFESLVHPEDRLLMFDEMKKFGNAQNLSITTRLRKKNGDYLFVSWVVSRSQDNVTYLIGRDITDIISMKERIESATKTKSIFLANMNHELRTPLNGILGMMTLLAEENMSPAAQRYLEVMKKSGNSLLELINDTLDFSKIEAGKIVLEKVSFNLSDTVFDVVSLLYHSAKEKGILIHIKLDPKINKFVSADVTRFRQVLTNLLGNAIKFTPSGSITIEGTSNHVREGVCSYRFDIIDTGLGMSKDMQSKLFQTFSQIDGSTTRKFGGTGLGLAICRGICEAMNGKIWVESELGHGSTFSFTFEAEKADASSVATSEPADTNYQDFSRNYPYRILVADDHSTNHLLARKFLEKLGYKPDIVSSGIEVLKIIEQKSYDVIFMDGHMPEMDGYEATQKIHERYGKENSPWIIALTASVSKEDRARCFSCGMDDFVPKPFSVFLMADALRRVKNNKVTEESSEVTTKETYLTEDSFTFSARKISNHFGGDEDIMQDVIKSFLIKLPEDLEKIKISIESNHGHDLMMAAHSLKGRVSNFFDRAILKNLQELETMGRENRITDGKMKYVTLMSQLEKLKINLESMINGKYVA